MVLKSVDLKLRSHLFHVVYRGGLAYVNSFSGWFSKTGEFGIGEFTFVCVKCLCMYISAVCVS